jgi:hypothetical protein
MNKFVEILKTKRDTIVKVLMWEICKVQADAEKEFDRTIDYIDATIKAAKALRNSESTFRSDGGIIAQIRRLPLGVMLNLGIVKTKLSLYYPFTARLTLLSRTVQLPIQRNLHHPHSRDSHGQLGGYEAPQRRLPRCVCTKISTYPRNELTSPPQTAPPLDVQHTSLQWRSFGTAFPRGW